MLVCALYFLVHLTITARSQYSSAMLSTAPSLMPLNPPKINEQTVSLYSRANVFIWTNYIIASNLARSNENPRKTKFPNRIVGGHQIPIRRAPWQVLIIQNRLAICGGSILSRYWVLTAEHCVNENGSYSVRAGSRFYKRSGQIRRVRKIIFYNGSNPPKRNADIALLKVTKPFYISEYARPVKLVGIHWKLPKKYFVTGWGLTNEFGENLSRVLRGVQVKSINRRTCARLYRGLISITKEMICAASRGKDACFGDSGGPLVHRGIQYGITSFGHGCARRNFPGVYTDIRKFRNFIRSVMRRYKD